MVMVWLEGWQGEVRGAYDPSPKSPHLDPPPRQLTLPEPPPPKPLLDPPHRPSPNPPSNAPPPPPKGASGQQLVGGVVGVQMRGVAPSGGCPSLPWPPFLPLPLPLPLHWPRPPCQ